MSSDAHVRHEATSDARSEARVILRLAAPVAVAQVGQLSMGLVDTWFVGQLGPTELAAVALGDALYFSFAVLAMGIIQALDPLVSQAFGARDAARCATAWRAGLRLSLLLTLPLCAVLVAIPWALRALGSQDPGVVQALESYTDMRAIGVLPWLLYTADRCLLHGLGATRPAMVVTLLANVLNVVLDYAFIFGHLGAPALGVAGAGLTTSACRWFMWGALTWWLRSQAAYRPYCTASGGSGWTLVGRAFRLGLPLGLAHSAEVGAFAAASFFMGWLGVVPLAAHQVAIKMAATSFMVAVAIGTATGIRVGQAIGARAPEAVGRAGWVGLGLGLVCMGSAGVVYLTAGRHIAAFFSDDPAVVAMATGLLAVAAAFQLSDGAQAIAAGALRGAGDTLWPLVINIAAHWGLALPLGYLLGFRLGLGPVGIWWALMAGLTATALLLVLRFRHVQRRADPV